MPDESLAATAELAIVKTLFDLAHITMADDELAGLARSFPAIRAQADSLYRDEFQSESPVLVFDPAAPYSFTLQS